MTRSRVLLASLATAATVAGLITSIPSAQAVPPQQITFAGGAFGTNVSVGTLVKVGKTGTTGICTRYPGQTASNSTAGLTLPQIGTVGAVQTQTNSALDASNNPVSTASAQTAATSLLGGLVSFDAVTSTSSLTRATDGTVTTSGSTTFVGLSVDGNPFNLNPPKNTVYNLAGIATLRFNTQAKTSTLGTDSFRVTALTINLLSGNTLGLPAGLIQIGTATAAIHGPTYAKAGGSAFGTSIQVGNVLKSGKTALVSAGCGGTDGVTRTNNLAGVHVSTTLNAGALTTTAKTTAGTDSTTSTATATIAGVNLLAGLVTADSISAVASFTRSPSGVDRTGSGATFTNLKVGGVPITLDPGENRVINLVLAKVEINTVTPTGNGVTAIGLRVTLLGGFGTLPAGAVITVASALATATQG